MKVEDACGTWDFEPKLKTSLDLVKCPCCKNFSALDRWEEGEVGCELCGSHAAMICPNCNSQFDHVWHYPFEVENAVGTR